MVLLACNKFVRLDGGVFCFVLSPSSRTSNINLARPLAKITESFLRCRLWVAVSSRNRVLNATGIFKRIIGTAVPM